MKFFKQFFSLFVAFILINSTFGFALAFSQPVPLKVSEQELGVKLTGTHSPQVKPLQTVSVSENNETRIASNNTSTCAFHSGFIPIASLNENFCVYSESQGNQVKIAGESKQIQLLTINNKIREIFEGSEIVLSNPIFTQKVSEKIVSLSINGESIPITITNVENSVIPIGEAFLNPFTGRISFHKSVMPLHNDEVIVEYWVREFTPVENHSLQLDSVKINSNLPSLGGCLGECGSVSGSVFFEWNGNGVIDVPFEEGYEGWSVFLENNSVFGDVVEVLTDVNGFFSFVDVPFGSYSVFVDPSGRWVQTLPENDGVYGVVVDGDNLNVDGLDFAVFKHAKIRGCVFNDLNSDGVWDDGEPKIPFRKAWLKGNSLGTFIEKYEFTQAAGCFVFDDVTYGNYKLSVELSDSVNENFSEIVTFPNFPNRPNSTYPIFAWSGRDLLNRDFGIGSQEVTLSSEIEGIELLESQNNSSNFGLNGSVSGSVFFEWNGNGVIDVPFEEGYEGWSVFLENNSVFGDVVEVLTDVNGFFSFVDVPFGSYSVFVDPSGRWVQTLPENDGVYGVVVDGDNLNVDGLDFAVFKHAKVSGCVYRDDNSNGERDDGESLINFRRVYLKGNSLGEMVDRYVNTGLNGCYNFSDVTYGNYKLSVELSDSVNENFVEIVTEPDFPNRPNSTYPIFAWSGRDLLNRDFGIGSQEVTLSSEIEGIELLESQNNQSFFSGDQGIPTTPPSHLTQCIHKETDEPGSFCHNFGEIQGCKFNDENNNGEWDEQESGIPNWTIFLENDSLILETTTGDDGCYLFSNIEPGNYTVFEEQKNGWIQTFPSNPNYYLVEVEPFQVFQDLDFGNHPQTPPFNLDQCIHKETDEPGSFCFNSGKVSGCKFNDENGNGEWDKGEGGIEGWTIYLSSIDELVGGEIWDTKTGEDGCYLFEGVKSGEYEVFEQQEVGWIQTFPTDPDFYSIEVIGAEEINGLDFGNNFVEEEKASVSGCKFNDENNNGSWDKGEQTLEDWTIYLALDFDGVGGCIQGESCWITQTGKDGCYEFEDVQPNYYELYEGEENGWIQTFPSNPNYYSFEVIGNESFENLDFGNHFEIKDEQATRSQGFWAVRFEAASNTWIEVPSNERVFCSMNMGNGPNEEDIGEMEGGFWSSISKKSDESNRTNLDKARMRLAQQLLAAMLNVQAFGAYDKGLISQGKTVFEATDIDAIDLIKDSLEVFNLSGESNPFPDGFNPGSADPQTAQDTAIKEFWDNLCPESVIVS